jgi:hypothetical protein
MRRRVLPLVLVTLTAGTATGAPSSPSARLVYARSSEAASCPDETALRKAVAARFGYDPFFAWAKQTAIVQVWRSDQRYRSRVQIVDAQGVSQGSRELASDGESCAPLFDATALAISIALDASTALAPPPQPKPGSSVLEDAGPDATAPTSPPPRSEPNPASADSGRLPSPDSDAALAQASTTSPALRSFAGLAVLGSTNVAPSPAAGLSAFAGVRWRDASLALEARADAPAFADVPTGGRITSWIYGASLVPCGHYSVASLCAVGLLGSLQAWSSNVSSTGSDQTLFAAAGGRVAVELPLSRLFAFRLHGDLLANLQRSRLRIGADPPWTAPPYMVTLGAGVAVHFP